MLITKLENVKQLVHITIHSNPMLIILHYDVSPNVQITHNIMLMIQPKNVFISVQIQLFHVHTVIIQQEYAKKYVIRQLYISLI